MWDGFNLDSIVNAITSLGGEGDRHSETAPGAPWVFPERMLDRLYLAGRVNRRIVDRPPQDATRRGWNVDVEGVDIGPDDVATPMKRLGVRSKFREAHKMARQSGGALCFFVVDDGRTPDKPVDKSNIREVEAIHVMDRFDVQGLDDEGSLQSKHWREPEYYRVRQSAETEAESGQRIHRSRVVRWEGLEVPEDTKHLYDGWGQPVLEATWEAIRDLETATEAMATSAHHFQFRVLKLKSIKNLLTDKAGNADESKFKQRLKAIQASMSVLKMIVLDKEESIETKAVDFSGIRETYQVFQQNLAAACNIPLTLLFGQPPQGFSSEDETALQNYYDHVRSIQDESYRPALDYAVELLFRSQSGPTSGEVPDDWSIKFTPLSEPTEAEKAEVAKLLAQVDAQLVDRQVYTADEARERWTADEIRAELPIDDEDQTDSLGDFRDALEKSAELLGEEGDEDEPSEGPAVELGRGDSAAPEVSTADVLEQFESIEDELERLDAATDVNERVNFCVEAAAAGDRNNFESHFDALIDAETERESFRSDGVDSLPIYQKPPGRLDGFSPELREEWLDTYNGVLQNRAEDYETKSSLVEYALREAWTALVATKVANVS